MTIRDILASEGLLESQAKTAAGFNVASPFARKLEDLFGVLMGPGSRVSVRMGRGEFSNKMGMQVMVIAPNSSVFVADEDGEEWDQKTEVFETLVQGVENRLSEYFGLPVHTETTEDTAIIYTVELRVQS